MVEFPYKLVPLWTDVLFWVLLLLAMLVVFQARRRPHLRAPWARVARSRTGMMTAVILLTFIGVGVLDSVHLRAAETSANGENGWSHKVSSVLDILLDGRIAGEETTYSAPFATHSFEKVTEETEDGGTRRINPRLKHGGAHLTDPAKKWPDISSKAMHGAVKGLVVWAVLAVVLMLLISFSRRLWPHQTIGRLLRGRLEIPWLTVLLTIALICALIGALSELAPAWHVLGTDKVGKDVMLQAVKSIRTGLMIGTLTTLVMLPFAIMLGIMAGYFGKWVDDVIQYLYTTLSSIPGVLLIAAAVLSLQVYMANHPEFFETAIQRNDLRLLFLCLILGITSWTGLCRLLRGETLKSRELDYVQAARGFGVGHMTIITRHILPNVMHIVLITVVLDFSGLVLAEAVLSYVGIGVDPSMDSWGNMINRARLEMAREPVVWWSLLASFSFMFTLVLSANLFADVVRDAFDPRLRAQEA